MYPALTRGRHSLPGQVYLCTTVTTQRAPAFLDFGRACSAARELQAMSPSHWNLLAWVVMPDHVHVLVAIEDTALSDCMRLFKGRTSRFIGAGRGLWQRGFHDHALRREEDLVAVARYVVANPLRAGLVRRLGDYPFWNCVWL